MRATKLVLLVVQVPWLLRQPGSFTHGDCICSSSVQFQDMEACSVASSTLSESLMLELDILSIEADYLEDLPALSPQYEELVKAIT